VRAQPPAFSKQEHNMDYIGILTRAAKLMWKQKIIYVFFIIFYATPSILMLLVMGVFAFTVDMSDPERFFRMFNSWMNFENPLVLIGMIGAYILLMLLTYSCYIFGFIGALKGASLAERGAESIDFKVLLQAGLKHFLPLAAVFFVIGVALIAIMVPAIILGPFIFLAFLCLIPVFIAGRMVVELLCAAIVNDDLGLLAALDRFWQLVQKNLWPLVLMALILVVVDFVANMVVTLPVSVFQQVVMQFMFLNPAMQQDPSIMFGQMFKWMFVIMIFIMPIMLVLQGLVMTYHIIATSLTYLAISEKPFQSAPAAESAPADLQSIA
jgi:hypothetical protein